MEFINFINLVREEVENRIGEGYTVKVNEVIKNNGVVLSGLTVMNGESNISPTIYLNAYYDAYERNETSINKVVEGVIKSYEKNKVNRSIDMKCFMDYERIKDRIVYKLINTKQNERLLKDVPSMNFYDLSIVFQFLISEEDFTSATILIHNAHLKIWNVSVEELYEAACRNTPILNQYHIKSIRDTIVEMMSTEIDEDYGQDMCLENNVPMYVLSNRNRINGAACMLYPDLIRDFSQAVDKDLFIIPSSVHELLLLPTDDSTEVTGIKEMVREINDTEVETEEILSYSVYYYNRRAEKIVMM